jgi:hypothetical protein
MLGDLPVTELWQVIADAGGAPDTTLRQHIIASTNPATFACAPCIRDDPCLRPR